MVGLVIAPILGGHSSEEGLANNEKEVSIEMTIESKDMAKATVNYSTIKDGEKVSEVIVFEGTEAEVKKELEAFEATVKSEAKNVEKIIEEVNITKE